MRRCLFLFVLLNSLSWAAAPRVEIRNSEVWIVADGQARQLTSDGRSKLQAALSPAADRIAYYQQCPQSEKCLTSVIILDLEGRRLQSFHPIAGADPPPGPCASILDISWRGENAISAECHINPSLSEYIETDLATGKPVEDLLGYGFTPSPDGKYVAHAGPVIHFAAPINQSNYLYIGNTVVYPLLKGAKPSEKQPEVVRQKGATWIGVHEFMPKFSWSPDSKRVAFIDCLFDWIEKGVGIDGATPIGDETNRRCFVAVVARTGQFELFPVTGGPVADENAVNFSWIGPSQLSARIGAAVKTFNIK